MQPNAMDLLTQCVNLSPPVEQLRPMERFPFSWMTTKEQQQQQPTARKNFKRRRTDTGDPFCLHFQTTRSVITIDIIITSAVTLAGAICKDCGVVVEPETTATVEVRQQPVVDIVVNNGGKEDTYQRFSQTRNDGLQIARAVYKNGNSM